MKFTDAREVPHLRGGAAARAEPRRARPPLTPSDGPDGCARADRAGRAEPAPAAAGMPGWIWLAGLAAIAFVLWRCFSRGRAATAAGAAALPGAGYGTPMQAGAARTAAAPSGHRRRGHRPYGPGYATQRPGSGMLGVGLGAAGGLAAGMLAERHAEPAPRGRARRGRDTGRARPASSIRRRAASAASDLGRPADRFRHRRQRLGLRLERRRRPSAAAGATAAAAGTEPPARRSAAMRPGRCGLQQAALLDERDHLGQAVAGLQVGHHEGPGCCACAGCRPPSRRGRRRRRARGRSC